MNPETDIRELLFKYRSYTPVPFLIVMIWFAEPTFLSLFWGCVMMFLGEALRFWGVSIAGSETRYTGALGGSSLVTTGPFAYVRNPLYVGNVLMYAGVGVMSMALFPWLVIVAVCWFFIQYHLIVAREEEHLEKTFGAEYNEYRKHVRKFIPRFPPYRNATSSQKSADFKRGIRSERRTFQAMLLVTLIILAKYFLQSQG